MSGTICEGRLYIVLLSKCSFENINFRKFIRIDSIEKCRCVIPDDIIIGFVVGVADALNFMEHEL